MTQSLTAHAFNFFKPRARLGVLEWAEKSVELSPRITEQPGPYSVRLYPYVAEVLENLTSQTVQRVGLCWGSQTGKTTTFYIMLGYTIDQRPRPILWVLPNENLVKSFSADRWLPFCRESKAILKHVPRYNDGTLNLDLFTLKKQEFDSCTMNLTGAGSSANIRSFPIAILVLDEIDVIYEQTRRECLDRIKGRADFKVLQSSTPVDEFGGIWQVFNEGDRRRFHVPCPHCQKKMVFKLRNDAGDLNLIWDESAKLADGWNLPTVADTAFYKCEKCGGKINDAHKLKMIQAGKWIASNTTAEKGSRTYHLNSFYSPVITFGRMAVEYLKAETSLQGMRAFVNGWLAEPYRPSTDTPIDPAQFKQLEKSGHQRGDIVGEYRVLSVDVQRSYFVWLVRGFDLDGTSYLIDNGTAPAFEDLTAIADRYEASYGAIDTGYRTQEIYEEIFKARQFWFGVKGWDKMPTPYRITKLDPYTVSNKQNRPGGGKINLFHVNKQVWQEELLKKRNGSAFNWFLYEGADTEYMRQLFSTSFVEGVNKAGNTERKWVVTGRHDHFWDCETYALALSSALGIGAVKSEGNPPKLKKPFKKVESIWEN